MSGYFNGGVQQHVPYVDPQQVAPNNHGSSSKMNFVNKNHGMYGNFNGGVQQHVPYVDPQQVVPNNHRSPSEMNIVNENHGMSGNFNGGVQQHVPYVDPQQVVPNNHRSSSKMNFVNENHGMSGYFNGGVQQHVPYVDPQQVVPNNHRSPSEMNFVHTTARPYVKKSDEEKKDLAYGIMRIKNNDAVRKCRRKQKEKREEMENNFRQEIIFLKTELDKARRLIDDQKQIIAQYGLE